MSDETTEVAAVDRDAFWLKLAQDAHSASSTYFDTAIRNRVIQDIRQFQGEHPEGSKYFTDAYRLKSKLFRPKTRSAIRKNEATAAAAFFSTEDVVAIRPEDDNDPMHQAAAKFHKSLLQYRLTRPEPNGLPWFVTCLGAYQEAEVVGVVGSYQEWLQEDDRPEIRLLPIENYRFDSASDWRNPVKSSPYFIIEWPMYVRDVKERMESGKWRNYADSEIRSAAKNSNDTIRLTREAKGVDSKESAGGAVSDFSIVWVHENFVRVKGKDVVFFTLGTQKMLDDPQLVDDVHPQGRPVVIGFTIVEAHKAYKSSTSTITRDVQSEINDVANERRHAVRLANDKRYIVKRGAQVDLRSLTRNIPASVTLANDPNSDVRVVTTDDATASAYQEQDRLNLDFDDMAGVFSGSSVASNRRLNETVGGMQMLSTNANAIGEYQLRTFTETWVEPVLRQIIILEQYTETSEKVLAMAAKAAGIPVESPIEELQAAIEQLIMQDVILKCNVGTGSVNPQNQLERFVYAMKSTMEIVGPDAFKRPLNEQEQEIVKEIFGKCGYKDGARFLVQGDKQEDPRIQQMVQQIQQMKAALAAKNPPEVVAATVAKLEAETALKKVEAIEGRIQALFAAMNTAQTAVTVPGVTPVADAIAKSAGFEDMDAAPIYPQDVQQQVIPQEAMIPQNTSPNFPAQADSGMMAGVEGGAQ
jgi:hypothetical protein